MRWRRARAARQYRSPPTGSRTGHAGPAGRALPRDAALVLERLLPLGLVWRLHVGPIIIDTHNHVHGAAFARRIGPGRRPQRHLDGGGARWLRLDRPWGLVGGLSRIAQLDPRNAVADQCLHPAQADVRPRRGSGYDPKPVIQRPIIRSPRRRARAELVARRGRAPWLS